MRIDCDNFKSRAGSRREIRFKATRTKAGHRSGAGDNRHHEAVTRAPFPRFVNDRSLHLVEVAALPDVVPRIRMYVSTKLGDDRILTYVVFFGISIDIILSCLVPGFDGAFLSHDSKDALWDKF